MNMNVKMWKKAGAILIGLVISAGTLTAAIGGETEAVADTAATGGKTGAVIETAADKPALLHPVILEASRSQSVGSGEETSASASAYIHYPQIGLTGEEVLSYPELQKALDAYNAGKKSWYESQLTELVKSAQEMAKYREEEGVDDAASWIYLTQVADTQIGRADSRIFSVIEHYSSYTGGAHGYYQDMGNTFDSQSGEKLAFADVVTDCDAAAAHVFEKLAEQYPDLDPFMSQADVASDMKGENTQGTGETNESGEMFTEGSDQAEMYFSWYVTDLGVMVVFPPYTLGSYAEGQQKILLTYAEYPEIFNPKYTVVPDSFIVPLDPDAVTQVDVDGNGSLEKISVSAVMDEDGSCAYTKRTITLSGGSNGGDSGNGDSSILQDTYYYSAEYYLVKSGEDMFLYCFDHEDNDYVELKAYLLSGGHLEALPYGSDDNAELVGSDTGNLSPRETWESGIAADSADNITVQYPLIDPDAMQLSSRMNALSTYSAYRTYSATPGPDGYLSPLDPYYIVDAVRTVTLKQDVTLPVVGEDGTGTEEGQFTAGSAFTLYRTDGTTFVDLKSDTDGSIVRVNSDFSQWPHIVMGMEEEALFDGVLYAG